MDYLRNYDAVEMAVPKQTMSAYHSSRTRILKRYEVPTYSQKASCQKKNICGDNFDPIKTTLQSVRSFVRSFVRSLRAGVQPTLAPARRPSKGPMRLPRRGGELVGVYECVRDVQGEEG